MEKAVARSFGGKNAELNYSGKATEETAISDDVVSSAAADWSLFLVNCKLYYSTNILVLLKRSHFDRSV